MSGLRTALAVAALPGVRFLASGLVHADAGHRSIAGRTRAGTEGLK